MKKNMGSDMGLATLVVSLPFFVAACGEAEDGGNTGGTSSTGGSATMGGRATTGGAGGAGGAVDFSFTSFTLAEYPGFGPSPPLDASCKPYTDPTTKTLVAATQELTFSVCNTSTWMLNTGTRSLSRLEIDLVADAVPRIVPSDAMNCGADAGVLLLDVETTGGTQRFADDFYSGCPSELHAGRTFVTGLPDLWRALIIYTIK